MSNANPELNLQLQELESAMENLSLQQMQNLKLFTDKDSLMVMYILQNKKQTLSPEEFDLWCSYVFKL